MGAAVVDGRPVMSQPPGGMLHAETSPALARGPYAARHIVWPPANFREPTRDELSVFLAKAERGLTFTAAWKKIPTEELLRRLEVFDWFHDDDRVRSSSTIYDHMHDVRRELNSRSDAPVFRSLHRPRCHMCSHTTDRTWEATSETHDIVKPDDTAWHGFLCARCWSDNLKED